MVRTSDALTVKEVAEIKNCTERNIRKLVKFGKIEYIEYIGKSHKTEYLIPVSALSEKEQAKYYRNIEREQILADPNSIQDKVNKSLDNYTDEEREEIALWQDILKEWQEFRNQEQYYKKSSLADEKFVSYIEVSYGIKTTIAGLYKRYAAYKVNDYDGLVDKRGKHRKGTSKITKEMFQTFLYYALDNSLPPLSRCYQYMKQSIKITNPEQYLLIPSESTFRRHYISDVPEGEKLYGRYGSKAYDDIAGLYVRREYEDMQSNDYWIGDTHTIDVQSMGSDGQIHRLHLSAWMDARSGIMVGWHIGLNPSSQSSLYALRDGILRMNAIPKNIYVDNGREFLTFDFGGLGHRKKKLKNNQDRYDPPPVLKRLDIQMTNAIVKNARAKTIERAFRDFKDYISRLFGTFTGGNIMERPEVLKDRIKNKDVILDEQFKNEINELIENSFNYMEYGGNVKRDRGKRKIDVYYEYCKFVRRASKDELNLMLMRSTRAQKVGRRGIHITINGEKIDYVSSELKEAMFGKQVYCRYDPNDLSEVRIYDLEDKFIMSVPCADDTILKYGAGKEEIKEAQRKIRIEKKKVRENVAAIKALGYKTARELVLAEAMENKNNPAVHSDPKVIELVRAEEEALYKQAAGCDVEININRMIMSASKRMEDNDEEL